MTFKKDIVIKLILTMILLFGLQLSAFTLYGLTDSKGCLAGPIGFFSYGYDIVFFMFWFVPLLIFSDLGIKKILLLFIFNIILTIGLFYGVFFYFSDIFLFYLK